MLAAAAVGAAAVVVAVTAMLLSRRPKMKCSGSHVLITGGSSGIGREVAIEAARRGANVTIVARNKALLDSAVVDIKQAARNGDAQKIGAISLDVAGSFDSIQASFSSAEQCRGPIDMLINCAGIACCKDFESTSPTELERLLRVNVLGSLLPTQVVIAGMKKRRRGRICFVSSQAGQLGLYGYVGYSASKFAVRGAAEALQMEVARYGIRISLSFPPDTDTPQLLEENKTKPAETKAISSTSGLWDAKVVGMHLLDGVERGNFLIPTGMDGWFLNVVTTGMSPVSNWATSIVEALLMTPLRFVSMGYLVSFYRTCSSGR